MEITTYSNDLQIIRGKYTKITLFNPNNINILKDLDINDHGNYIMYNGVIYVGMNPHQKIYSRINGHQYEKYYKKCIFISYNIDDPFKKNGLIEFMEQFLYDITLDNDFPLKNKLRPVGLGYLINPYSFLPYFGEILKEIKDALNYFEFYDIFSKSKYPYLEWDTTMEGKDLFYIDKLITKRFNLENRFSNNEIKEHIIALIIRSSDTYALLYVNDKTDFLKMRGYPYGTVLRGSKYSNDTHEDFKDINLRDSVKSLCNNDRILIKDIECSYGYKKNRYPNLYGYGRAFGGGNTAGDHMMDYYTSEILTKLKNNFQNNEKEERTVLTFDNEKINIKS